MKDGILVALLVALFMIFVYGLSWIATCGLIKLITMCFGWNFSWAISTGLWLVMCLVMHVIRGK